jgi:multisubunit Na+/H+ antiporter MnhC subunit
MIFGDETELLGRLLYMGAFGLLLLGLYAVATRRHFIRVLLGLSLVEGGVNLFLIAVGYVPGAQAPILVGAHSGVPMVDPIPQALILTSIVIGVGVSALGLALAVRAHDRYGTLDLRELARRIAAEEPKPDSPAGVPARSQGGGA